MSSQMMVKAWETPRLTPSERLVLLALADCSDRDGRNAFIGERTIAEHTQLGLRTVKLAIQQLRVKGHIVVQALPTNRRSTTYQLFPSTGAESAPTPNTVTGAESAPHVGASPAPLGVQQRVQKTHAGGAKTAFPPTPPYKEDPVFDPVDPGLLSLLTKAVHAVWEGNAALDGETLLDSVRRYAAARRWPHDTSTLTRAIDLARTERQRRAS